MKMQHTNDTSPCSSNINGKEVSATDPEIKELIKNIFTSQNAEINQIKAKLKELDK